MQFDEQVRHRHQMAEFNWTFIHFMNFKYFHLKDTKARCLFGGTF